MLVAACGNGGQGAASPTADPAKDKLANILDRGTLVAYTADDYAPQSMAVEGATRPANTKCLPTQRTATEMTGFDNETTKLVANDLGVEACFVVPTWTELTAGGWGDRWDIAYGSGSINRDRMKRLYMTQPYYATPNMFFVRSDSQYQTAGELSGKKVGVCASCSHEYYLKHELEIPGVTLEYDIEDPQIVAYETESPGLEALADGKIDAFLAAAPVGQAEIDAGLALRALDKPAFTYFPSGFVDKSSGLDVAPFMDRVNTIIRSHQADGSLKALSQQFFGHDYATEAAAFDLSTIGQTIP
jgi:polar amino acid transport system substrate-binding protein